MDDADTRVVTRRMLVTAGIRAVLTTALLVVVYYRAPLDGRLDRDVVIWLGIGLVALVAALAWQVRMIMTSDTPRLRAAQTVATGVPILLLLYAATYAVLSQVAPASFSQPLDRTGALYYTMTVFTTVGFGDIAPATGLTRILTMSQMVVGLLAVGVVAKLLLEAVQVAVRRRTGPGP
ncbi:metal transporter [Pseudonocardia sulfidoxydans NBRC 16205]|uniref:Metal transporter n=1 Tax=Pseudonocardia sulfidoxydans NBRC 16205 TaxID=1223511 RepID=A0A511DDV9_9PSEU|nr:potassium channel family protein [Pseudonocardia sulfidoxydans]GEL21168.1 metal transporter [Pseudonocardia sulfidoxydans NBRC 16205]